MKYLVDANLLSEPTKVAPEARVIDWLRKHESDLVVDSIILGRRTGAKVVDPFRAPD
jgi:hypothetical protein